jgi:hypothetical protein
VSGYQAGVAPKRLGIYLNDHLAGATVGLNLARRCQQANEGSPLGHFLSELVDEISSDREALLSVMKQLGVPVSRAKLAVAWGLERLGRLKLNGQIRGYSPLSRLIELEGLGTGIEGKRSLWLVLAQLSSAHSTELETFDFEGLARRAGGQRARLEPYRLEAAQLLV